MCIVALFVRKQTDINNTNRPAPSNNQQLKQRTRLALILRCIMQLPLCNGHIQQLNCVANWREPMQMTEIKTIAKQYGVKISKLKKAELIKQIQLAEGNFDCYATPVNVTCNQEKCLWRSDCLKAA